MLFLGGRPRSDGTGERRPRLRPERWSARIRVASRSSDVASIAMARSRTSIADLEAPGSTSVRSAVASVVSRNSPCSWSRHAMDHSSYSKSSANLRWVVAQDWNGDLSDAVARECRGRLAEEGGAIDLHEVRIQVDDIRLNHQVVHGVSVLEPRINVAPEEEQRFGAGYSRHPREPGSATLRRGLGLALPRGMAVRPGTRPRTPPCAATETRGRTRWPNWSLRRPRSWTTMVGLAWRAKRLLKTRRPGWRMCLRSNVLSLATSSSVPIVARSSAATIPACRSTPSITRRRDGQPSPRPRADHVDQVGRQLRPHGEPQCDGIRKCQRRQSCTSRKA